MRGGGQKRGKGKKGERGSGQERGKAYYVLFPIESLMKFTLHSSGQGADQMSVYWPIGYHGRFWNIRISRGRRTKISGNSPIAVNGQYITILGETWVREVWVQSL